MKRSFDPRTARLAIQEAIPETAEAGSNSDIPPGYMYVPRSHAFAIDPERSIVEGMRGAGKTFWYNVLLSSKHRKYLNYTSPEAGYGPEVLPYQGFGEGISDSYPGKDEIASITEKLGPRFMWRAVIGKCLGFAAPFPQGTKSWPILCQWVKDNPSMYNRLLEESDLERAKKGKKAVILFDALDRLAEDWKGIRPIAKALFQVALEMRSMRSTRMKLFVRPDMVEDTQILSFPDSSKLKAMKVKLEWRRADLYAMLFQRLSNTPKNGEWFRDQCSGKPGENIVKITGQNAYRISAALQTDEIMQRDLFHVMTGPTMAKGSSGHKRGFPYSWLVSHLMDSLSQVSPRSFCIAIKEAAFVSAERNDDYAMAPKSIQEGVRTASGIRGSELAEDYPWVNSLMAPLKGKLSIPCLRESILGHWQEAGTLSAFSKGRTVNLLGRLPPKRIDEGPSGLLGELEQLGIIQFLADGRVQMPDVYRIAFGLGRKGGVRPMQ